MTWTQQLTEDQIRRAEHRNMVGGLWEEIGQLQFDFLLQHGLARTHRILDVGCGSLRGGIQLIPFLEPGHYYGMDINPSLIKAGLYELTQAGLDGRDPHLLVDGSFNFSLFETTFHRALAQSVFTHLTINQIERCLVEIAKVLEPGGRFYATYFESPTRHRLLELRHQDGVVTHSDSDPYHYHFSLFEFLVADLPVAVRNVGPWNHPRGQHMLEFVRVP